VFERCANRRALQHTVLEGGVILELLDRHTVPFAPAVDDERIGVGNRITRAENPLLAIQEPVWLLQELPGILAPGRFHVIGADSWSVPAAAAGR
jgi:hypothetical protein